MLAFPETYVFANSGSFGRVKINSFHNRTENNMQYTLPFSTTSGNWGPCFRVWQFLLFCYHRLLLNMLQKSCFLHIFGVTQNLFPVRTWCQFNSSLYHVRNSRINMGYISFIYCCLSSNTQLHLPFRWELVYWSIWNSKKRYFLPKRS